MIGGPLEREHLASTQGQKHAVIINYYIITQ